jgi:glycosyltransferase involved in cell wall biosynthesis
VRTSRNSRIPRGSMPERAEGAQVVPVSLDEPLKPITVEPACSRVVLVVTLGGRFVGDVLLQVRQSVSVEDQRRGIRERLGEQLWSMRLRDAFTRAARSSGQPVEHPVPAVSVIVGSSGQTAELSALLQSLLALQPGAHEVVVVETGRQDDSAREVCSAYGARHLEEDSPGIARAWNRGIVAAGGKLVALLEADWLVDRRWLEGLGEAFADPLVAGVAGYDHRLPASLEGSTGRVVYDFTLPQPKLEGGCFIRRGVFAEVGLFSELLGSGASGAIQTRELSARLLRAGYRFVFDPARIAWRRPGAARRGRPLVEAAGRRSGRRLVLRPRAKRRRPPLDLRAPRTPAAPPRVVEDDDPPLSLAIASYNRREPLAKVLSALAEQTYPPERFEVLVVLDGSTDGSAEHARSLDLPYRLRLLEQDNRGLAASRNRGAREASAPVVVFLDDDILPEPAFLAEHAAGHREGRDGQVVLGHCPPAKPGSDLLTLISRHFWEDYFRRRAEPDHQWNYTDFGDGNVSLPRSLLLESGGWDEQFARGTVRRQDWEFGIRLLQSGVRFVDRPEARGWHHFELSLETALRNRRVEGRSDVLLGTKHPHVRGHLFLARLLGQAAARRFSDVRSALRHPAPSRWAVRLGRPLALLPDRVGRRRLSYRLIVKLVAHSYIIGVRDALPSREQLRDFVAPIVSREGAATLPVWLDREGSLAVPPSAGAIDLVLGYAGDRLAHVAAPEPEGQWDWEFVTERVVREALEPFKQAVAGAGNGAQEPVPELSTLAERE